MCNVYNLVLTSDWRSIHEKQALYNVLFGRGAVRTHKADMDRLAGCHPASLKSTHSVDFCLSSCVSCEQGCSCSVRASFGRIWTPPASICPWPTTLAMPSHIPHSHRHGWPQNLPSLPTNDVQFRSKLCTESSFFGCKAASVAWQLKRRILCGCLPSLRHKCTERVIGTMPAIMSPGTDSYPSPPLENNVMSCDFMWYGIRRMGWECGIISVI